MATDGDPDLDQPQAEVPPEVDAVVSGLFPLIDMAPEGITLAVAAAALRERIYGSIACLSTLVVITAYQPLEHPGQKLLDVLIATGGLWAASVLAEYLSHLGAHQKPPSLRQVRHLFWVSGQIMAASGIPLALLVFATFDVVSLHFAVWAGVWVLVVEMGFFAFLAVRRTSLRWWTKTLLVGVLITLGLLVVFLKTLAH